MNINEHQEKVDKFIKSTKTGYFTELSNLAQLTEEVGELSRIINRTYGNQTSKPTENITKEALADELADILFVLSCIANQTEIDLSEAITKNFQKKESRDKNRN